jgi:hypothetical protein
MPLAIRVDLSQACPCFADELLCGPYSTTQGETDRNAVLLVKHIPGAFKSAFSLAHVLPGTGKFEVEECDHHPISVVVLVPSFSKQLSIAFGSRKVAKGIERPRQSLGRLVTGHRSARGGAGLLYAS